MKKTTTTKKTNEESQTENQQPINKVTVHALDFNAVIEHSDLNTLFFYKFF